MACGRQNAPTGLYRAPATLPPSIMGGYRELKPVPATHCCGGVQTFSPPTSVVNTRACAPPLLRALSSSPTPLQQVERLLDKLSKAERRRLWRKLQAEFGVGDQ